MPDLTELRPMVGVLFLSYLGGPAAVTAKATLHRANYVRLVDKAIREYAAARAAIQLQMAESRRDAAEMTEGRVLYMPAFVDHFVTCINAMHRAVRLLDRLAQEGQPLDRESRKLIAACARDVTKIRDTLEHIDERVQHDEIGPGEPVTLGLATTDDAAVLAQFTVRFSDVAVALRRMHSIVLPLFGINAAGGGAC
jgi:hypothetical protein